MADFINNIKLKYKTGGILTKLIFINAGIFIFIGIVNVVGTLFKIDIPDIQCWLGVPADTSSLLGKPWTLLTYMFVHANLFHIFFNMLLLYWFGKIFLNYFSPRNLGGLYLMGGLAGAIFYIFAFNTIPYYKDMVSSIMVGASASVTAIIFAAAAFRPNQEIILLIFGKIKIIYIALFIFIIDFLALGSPDNPGGHIAHIGGAAMGYLFAKQYLAGKDLTKWMNKLLDWLANILKPKPKKMKVKYKRPETDYEYNQRKHQETENLDRILDKIKMSGYSSLSKDEKKQLFDASKK